MEKDSSQQDNVQKPVGQKPVAPVSKNNTEMFMTIRRVTAWVMILSAILFAMIGILAIWEVLGDNAGDVVWRAFSSLAIIAFAALVVNVASRAMMNKQ